MGSQAQAENRELYTVERGIAPLQDILRPLFIGGAYLAGEKGPSMQVYMPRCRATASPPLRIRQSWRGSSSGLAFCQGTRLLRSIRSRELLSSAAQIS